MRITLSNAGKRFNRDWIFRHLTFNFIPGETYAIVGPNGSGKSTLLQLLSGSMEISEGTIAWNKNEEDLDKEKVYQNVSLAAPYLELIEEMTAVEFLTFHHQFKGLLPGLTVKEIIKVLDLEKAANKQIRYYSSGMKQRVKLAQAIFSNTSLLLLDEPCTNLDTMGIDLYHRLVEKYCNGKTIVVSSNDFNEYSFCKTQINILDYK